MSRPKRAFFSLNVDSQADHIYQRTEDYNKEPKDRVKVREHAGPITGSSNVQIIGNPYEKEVQRSFERTVDGRVVRDTVSTYTTDQNKKSPSGKKKSKRRSIEERYDTSEL